MQNNYSPFAQPATKFGAIEKSVIRDSRTIEKLRQLSYELEPGDGPLDPDQEWRELRFEHPAVKDLIALLILEKLNGRLVARVGVLLHDNFMAWLQAGQIQEAFAFNAGG